jgi:hypothetical protein
MYLHADTAAGKAAAADPTVRAKLEAIRSAHAGLAAPAEAGRTIGFARH